MRSCDEYPTSVGGFCRVGTGPLLLEIEQERRTSGNSSNRPSRQEYAAPVLCTVELLAYNNKLSAVAGSIGSPGGGFGLYSTCIFILPFFFHVSCSSWGECVQEFDYRKYLIPRRRVLIGGTADGLNVQLILNGSSIGRTYCVTLSNASRAAFERLAQTMWLDGAITSDTKEWEKRI